MKMTLKILSLLLFVSILRRAESLTCYDGFVENATDTLDIFNKVTCQEDETWCFSLHSVNLSRPLEWKRCWNPLWDHGQYSQDGCVVGQHCLDGACYDNTTVCLCDQDNCNDWLPGYNGSLSTPMPVPPTTPASHHTCYYGIKENGSLSLDNTQICRDDQNLCVRITTEDEDGWEMRSCWDDDFNMEFSRPGCYKGFDHCHHGSCHNNTLLCVCGENMCNSEHFSSEAPPITPGSGLYCYHQDYHHDHGPHQRWAGEVRECDKGEDFCITITHTNKTDGFAFRGCWSTEYEEGRYNFTGCEVGQHCIFGDCMNNTVCVCEDDLCNDFGLSANATTEAPVPMTTGNNTMVCWYGMKDSSNVTEDWEKQICGPEETACMSLHGDDGFVMAACYDTSYNDGKYKNKTGCYDQGEHCWDNECHDGVLCLCDKAPLCNSPEAETSSVAPTTPGSGLTCLFGWYGEHGPNPGANLTHQPCDRNESLCLTLYDNHHNDTWFSCFDPADQDGKFAQENVCYEDTIFCDQGYHDDKPDCHDGQTVCTCDKDLCNNYNSSSSYSPALSTTTQADTMRCWFGEKHPDTGNETWKVDICLDNEDHCYQLVSKDGYEMRECWDLKYEDEEYAGSGCYSGKHCHHEHCWDDVTVCICDSPECNDWSPQGNVTTPVPVTDGSGVLCYTGSPQAGDLESSFCHHGQTMCSYLVTRDGTERGGCFDPTSNNGQFAAAACYDDVDVVEGDHKIHGHFCICEGQEEDLCNGQWFKEDPNSGSRMAASLIMVVTLIMIINM